MRNCRAAIPAAQRLSHSLSVWKVLVALTTKDTPNAERRRADGSGAEITGTVCAA
jgi:hypothetical protein